MNVDRRELLPLPVRPTIAHVLPAGMLKEMSLSTGEDSGLQCKVNGIHKDYELEVGIFRTYMLR